MNRRYNIFWLVQLAIIIVFAILGWYAKRPPKVDKAGHAVIAYGGAARAFAVFMFLLVNGFLIILYEDKYSESAAAYAATFVLLECLSIATVAEFFFKRLIY